MNIEKLPDYEINVFKNNNQSVHNYNDHRDRNYSNGQQFSRNNNSSDYSEHRRNNQRFSRSPTGGRYNQSNHFEQNQRVSPQRSNTPKQWDGYLKEFSFVENGVPKTVTAWVPLK